MESIVVRKLCHSYLYPMLPLEHFSFTSAHITLMLVSVHIIFLSVFMIRFQGIEIAVIVFLVVIISAYQLC